MGCSLKSGSLQQSCAEKVSPLSSVPCIAGLMEKLDRVCFLLFFLLVTMIYILNIFGDTSQILLKKRKLVR